MRMFHTPIGSKILALLLALLFVFPPEAVGRMSCATLAMLSLPMPCCALRSTATGADDGAQPCRMCTTTASRDAALATQSSVASSRTAQVQPPDGCCCSKSNGRDASTAPARDTNNAELASWIAERASISARAVHFECLAPHVRLHSDRGGPPPASVFVSDGGGSSSPAVGCARHDLLTRGVVGLLSDFCIALL